MKIKGLRLYQLGLRFPKTVLLFSVFLTILSLLGIQKLKVETDLLKLLPQSNESVQNLKKLRNAFGGMGYLELVIEGQDFSVTEKFADQLSQQLEKLPSVRYVDYRKPIEFFKKRQWLYLDWEDLQEIERRIDRSLELEKKGASPMMSGWVDFADEEDRPDLTFEDIRKKYEARLGGVSQTEHSSFPEGNKLILLRVKAQENAQNLENNRTLIAEVQKVVASLKKNETFSPIQVHFAGDYKSSIQQEDSIRKEIKWVSIVVFTLLFLILLFYFKRLSFVFFIIIPLAVGIFWAYGLIYFFLGKISIVASFAATILAGLGSDYGVYLLTRYSQERKLGADFLTSCHHTFSNQGTGKATYASMLTTVGAFAALMFSNFGVFIEFGIVGFLGLFSTYMAMMLLVPSLLSLANRHKNNFPESFLKFEKLFWGIEKIPVFEKWKKIFHPKAPVIGVVLVGLLIGMAAFSVPQKTRIYFENDQLSVGQVPADKLYRRVKSDTKISTPSTILITQSEEDERQVYSKLESELDHEPKKVVYKNILSLSSFIPSDQLEKKKALNRIYHKFQKIRLVLKDKKQEFLKTLEASLEAAPIVRESLPKEVRRMFESPYQKGAFATYLYPAFGRNDSTTMKKYYDGVNHLKRDLNLHFIAADASFVATELVSLVERETPKGMMMVILFLVGVTLLLIRPFKRALFILVNLIGSLVLVSGILWIFDLRLNVMNVAVFPIVLGTGIDCFIHFSHRFDELGDVKETVNNYLVPVFISNLTTIVGFGGLILTSGVGLQSMGWLAVIGLLVVTFMCGVIFPRCLILESLHKSKSLELEAEPASV